MKSKNRLEKWKKEDWFMIPFEHPVDPEFDKLIAKIPKDDQEELSNFTITRMAREFIFDIKDGFPVIHVICPILDSKTMKLKYEHMLDQLFDEDSKDIEKDVVNTLALAVALEVPVYPNTKQVEKQLAYYYRILLNDGFTAPGKDGEDIRLRLTNSKNLDDFKLENITNLDLSNYWSPSDLFLVQEVIKGELSKLNNVQRTLSYLELAIKDLESELLSEKRNENKLQKCLTSNPILLGLDYSNIIPKHKLGAEYEVDYALEKYSGLIDLMEIESSGLPLFTKGGNPSSYLVHAEQQVIDWIDWVEKNGAYARTNLDGLITPKGFVIIGRESMLNNKTRASLMRRNKAFNGLITILTYDDVLNKAKTILNILKREDIN